MSIVYIGYILQNARSGGWRRLKRAQTDASRIRLGLGEFF